MSNNIFTYRNLPINYHLRKDFSIRGFDALERGALMDCEDLESLYVAYGVQDFGDKACEYLQKLKSVIFENRQLFSPNPQIGLRIGHSAFANCPSLSTVKLADHTTEIDDFAFTESGIESINSPKSLKRIGEGAFSYCSKLKSFVIPEQVTKIEESTFKFCTELSHIQTHSGIETIEDNAFSHTNLESFHHSGDLKLLGYCALGKCSSLKSVKIDGTVEHLSAAFQDSENLEEVSFGDVIHIERGAFEELPNLRKVTGLNNTVSIGNSAFELSLIESLNFPATLETIGFRAFEESDLLEADLSKCSKLKSLKDSTFRKSKIQKLVMNDSIESIGQELCARCYNLTDVRLSDSIKHIPKDSFSECRKLQHINAPKNLESIGMESFYNNLELSSFNAEEKLTSIGVQAFANCAKLKNFSTKGEDVKIEHGAFASCTTLESFSARSIKNIDYFSFANCANLKTIEGLENVEEIGKQAFKGCEKLEKLKLSNPNVKIHETAFINCKFDYMYKTKNGDLVFSQTPPTPEEEATDVVNIKKYRNVIDKFSAASLLKSVSDEDKEFRSAQIQFQVDPMVDKFIDFLDKNGFSMTEAELSSWIKSGKHIKFLETADLDTYYEINGDANANKRDDSYIESIKKLDGNIDQQDYFDRRRQSFLMAYSLGCFSREEVNNSGKRTSLSRVATQTIKKLHNSRTIDMQKLASMFTKYSILSNDDSLPKVNKNLSKFLLAGETSEKVVNRDEKTTYYKRYYPNASFFIEDISDDYELQEVIDPKKSIIANFDETDNLSQIALKEVQRQRTASISRYMLEHDISQEEAEEAIDPISDGKVIMEAYNLLKSSKDNDYYGTKYEKHGELYGKLGLSKDYQRDAISLYEEAEENGVPHHILGKPLTKSSRIEILKARLKELEGSNAEASQAIDAKLQQLAQSVDSTEMTEEEIHAQIQQTIQSTSTELETTRTLLERLMSNKFSFELLDKYDERNAVAGLTIAECCANINGHAYGKHIAKNTIVDSRYQNIHIFDQNGESAGKVTIYVDEENSTILINSIELTTQYKYDQTDAGYYSSSPTSQRSIDRELIFDSILDGLYAFIDEYDTQHPEQPIEQVNLGHTYNRLKKQSDRYDMVHRGDSEFIDPPDYFDDASEHQYVLYRRGDKLTRNPELDEILKKKSENNNEGVK